MRPASLAVLVVLAHSACAKGDVKASADSAVPASPAASPSALPPSDDRPLAEGEARLAVDGGSIWYRVVGKGTGTPAILLHGGPGFNSYSLKPLEALGDDRPVVRYDQLGGGRSDGMTDTTRMNIPHFVAELDSLRAHLGYDRVHIVGHSWGTMLGFEYYRAHPERVASLTLGSPSLSIPEWEANAKRLIGTLPDESQRAIREAEASGKYDSPGYTKAMEKFYALYAFRRPVVADLDSMMRSANMTIYKYMQGASEFTVTGTLKHYDATPFLKDVKVPTLFTVGEFDEAGPEIVRKQAALVPGASVVVIPDAAHVTSWDNPKPLVDAIRAHLRNADAATKGR